MEDEYEFQKEKDSIFLVQEKESIAYQVEIAENKRILHLVIFGLFIFIGIWYCFISIL